MSPQMEHAPDCPASLGPMDCSCGAGRVNASASLGALSSEEAFLAHARVVQKRCQVGTGNLAAAHDILAEAYGAIGRLILIAEGVELPSWQPPAALTSR